MNNLYESPFNTEPMRSYAILQSANVRRKQINSSYRAAVSSKLSSKQKVFVCVACLDRIYTYYNLKDPKLGGSN